MNTELQNDEGIPSRFDIPCSAFCGFPCPLGTLMSSPLGEGFLPIPNWDNKEAGASVSKNRHDSFLLEKDLEGDEIKAKVGLELVHQVLLVGAAHIVPPVHKDTDHGWIN
jgi:hypothetical protein